MNILSPVTKILSRFPVIQRIRRIRFTQASVLMGGIIVLIMLFLAVIAWDAYLFTQSVSPLQASATDQSKQISLTPQTIDEGIDILNQRKQKFDNILQNVTGTTTISF